MKPPCRQVCRRCRRLLSRDTRRGLCWECRRIDSEVDFNGSGKKPANPTSALPGSEEKIAVLLLRASRGEMLHHPDDMKDKQGRAKSGIYKTIINFITPEHGW